MARHRRDSVSYPNPYLYTSVAYTIRRKKERSNGDGSGFDVWRDDEDRRRVKSIVGAFAERPKLPKMPTRRAIQANGHILRVPILGSLHHQYGRT
jgi:hypothetical protein